jgi:hypothetical protein
MQESSKWRAGDCVFHRPTGETWVLAYVDGDYLAWCGWPAGEAKVSDCELVAQCTDEEHLRLLRSLATSVDGKRARKAQADLQAFHLTDDQGVGARTRLAMH